MNLLIPFSETGMCGRYSLVCIDDLGQRFRVHIPTFGLRSRFNIAPGTDVPVIVAGGTDRRCVSARWGLVPSWAKDPAIGRRLINARAETLTAKPAFGRLVARKRCLIPASGFYEWTPVGQGRIPYYIRMQDDCLFAFAGLYDDWHDPAGQTVTTCVIITTEPNEVVRPIHTRMPAILREGDEEHWLAAHPLPAAEIARMLAPYPADGMEAYPVSTAVNSPASEGEGLIRRGGGWW
jgi:putative SOS response-associated peptidase YedK